MDMPWANEHFLITDWQKIRNDNDDDEDKDEANDDIFDGRLDKTEGPKRSNQKDEKKNINKYVCCA